MHTMLMYIRRFLLPGLAFFLFISSCDSNESQIDSRTPEGAQRAKDWNKQQSKEGISLAIIDTLPGAEDAVEARNIEEEVDSLENQLILAGLVDVQSLDPSIMVKLKYASKDNFLHQNVYGGLRNCYLQPEAAEKLVDASKRLQDENPNLRLLVYDAVRPRSVQFAMWRVVKGTPQQSYVASPKNGSVHNFGAAVDLTLATKEGKALDMGTPFDYFGKKAQPRYEDALLASGELTAAQVDNRKLLRGIMTASGFSIIRNEWWHFNAFSGAESRKRFKAIP